MQYGIKLGIEVSHMLRIFPNLKPRIVIIQSVIPRTLLIHTRIFFLQNVLISVQAAILVVVKYVDDVV